MAHSAEPLPASGSRPVNDSIQSGWTAVATAKTALADGEDDLGPEQG